MNKIIQLAGLGALLVFLSVSIASAQLGVPHQFFGEVTTNGNPAPDGLFVVARIDGQDVANTTTLNGAYGLLPGDIFYIEDPNGDRYGDIIEFFVQGVKAGEYVFSNFNSTELDFSVTGDLGICGDGACGSGESCSSCPQDCGSCPAPPSPPPGGGGGYYTPPCEENWTCSAWSICSQEGSQIRLCNDENTCGTEKEKPEQEKACTYTPAEAPITCSAGSRVCSENNLVECFEGRQWNVIEKCEHGCSDARCNPEPGEPGPGETGESVTTGEGEGEPAPGGGLAGYLIANPAVMFFGALVIIIFVLGGVIYWKARPKSPKQEAQKVPTPDA